jgi:hypothetical protein
MIGSLLRPNQRASFELFCLSFTKFVSQNCSKSPLLITRGSASQISDTRYKISQEKTITENFDLFFWKSRFHSPFLKFVLRKFGVSRTAGLAVKRDMHKQYISQNSNLYQARSDIDLIFLISRKNICPYQ